MKENSIKILYTFCALPLHIPATVLIRGIRTNKIFGDPRNYFFLPNFVYFIFFAWSKVGLVQKILKSLGKVAWFQYKTEPQKNKGVSQKNQNKNFVKKRIAKYFGGSDPINELLLKLPVHSIKIWIFNFQKTGIFSVFPFFLQEWEHSTKSFTSSLAKVLPIFFSFSF